MMVGTLNLELGLDGLPVPLRQCQMAGSLLNDLSHPTLARQPLTWEVDSSFASYAEEVPSFQSYSTARRCLSIREAMSYACRACICKSVTSACLHVYQAFNKCRCRGAMNGICRE